MSGPLINEVDVPEMQIVMQQSVAQEHFSKNGVQKQVHVVVKNIMFLVDVMTNFDLHKCNIDAKLLYDYDRDDVRPIEVSYVKSEPLEYKVNILEGGYKASVELRIKVLTSQHEDMLFRVRMTASEQKATNDGTPIATCEVITQPIRVISKLTQIKKREEGGAATPGSSTSSKKRASTSMTSPSAAIPSVAGGNDIILSLSRLEEQLQQQQTEHNKFFSFILQKLFVDPSLPLSALGQQTNESLQTLSNLITQQESISVAESYGSQSPSRMAMTTTDDKRDEFESLGLKFIAALDNIPQQEHQSRIESFIDSLSSAAHERFGEILNIYSSIPRIKRQKND